MTKLPQKLTDGMPKTKKLRRAPHSKGKNPHFRAITSKTRIFDLTILSLSTDNRMGAKITEDMKSSIRVIKQKRDEAAKESKDSGSEKSVQQNTREMVSTVKSWIAELQQRKRTQSHAFVSLHVIATPAQNT